MLKEADFEVFQTSEFTDNIRGEKLVIRWWNENWVVPGTLVLQEINVEEFRKQYRHLDLHGKNFASVTTAYALPSQRGKLAVRKSQIINPSVSTTAQKAAYEAKPRETIDRKNTERWSLDNPGGLDSEDKNLSLVRMLNFNGRVKRLKYNRCNNYRPQPRGRKSAAAIRETEASLIA